MFDLSGADTDAEATGESMTKSRREQAKTIKAMRDSGATWAEVTAEVSVSESTGRKMLKELDEAIADGRAAKVEPPKADSTPKSSTPAPKPKKTKARKAEPDEPKAPRSGRYLKLVCSCDEPLVIRTSKTVAKAASVRCVACGSLFEEAAA